MVHIRGIIAIALSLCLAAPVMAQDEMPQAPEEESLALEEVVVTATKRAEDIQEVPMSVTAFTSEFFKDSGVTNLSGLEQYTPSLKITPGTDSNATSIRIRGSKPTAGIHSQNGR